MDLRSMLTDDQIAVLGCFVALGVCGLIGLISFHFGPAGKSAQRPADSLRFPTRSSEKSTDESRKAA